MKLYSRAGIIDVNHDELNLLDRDGVFIGVTPSSTITTKIIIYMYGGEIIYCYRSGYEFLIFEENDIGDYAFLLEDLVMRYVVDIINFNTYILDLIINRIMNTFPLYAEESENLFSRFHRLLNQPDIKSAHN